MTSQEPVPNVDGDVIGDLQYLSAISVWPAAPAKVKPGRWLANFDKEDTATARALLESFMYFNESLTIKLLRAAYHGLSGPTSEVGRTYAELAEKWATFSSSAIVTFPTGEVPNPTDSGHLFLRYMRQNFPFQEEQLVSPDQAVKLITSCPRPLIMVDDFTGSGDQFLRTWSRDYRLETGELSSLQHACSAASNTVYYIPAVSTWFAESRIRAEASEVRVRAAHRLDERYSAVHPETFCLPEGLRDSFPEFVEKYSERAGIPPSEMLGHYDLALCLAFSHSVPDATLPIFSFDKSEDWHALFARQ